MSLRNVCDYPPPPPSPVDELAVVGWREGTGLGVTLLHGLWGGDRRPCPAAHIILAGDVNQLPNQDLVERRGLTQIVHQQSQTEPVEQAHTMYCWWTICVSPLRSTRS